MKTWLLALFVAFVAVAKASAYDATDRNALWKRVQSCAAVKNPPQGSCLFHSASKHFVLLKDGDPAKPRAYLILPTDRVPGIESPAVFGEPLLDIWRYGWEEGLIYVKAPVSRIGMAINSKPGRNQDQLHIHVSCSSLQTRQALEHANVTSHWGTRPFVTIGNRTYNAILVTSLAGKQSPWVLVSELPGAKSDMGDHTIAVVATKNGSWYVLDDYAHGHDKATAEAVLDERCS
jgi:CDP-diacylglycerol pyrophosphatase